MIYNLQVLAEEFNTLMKFQLKNSSIDAATHHGRGLLIKCDIEPRMVERSCIN
jgi:hypothetical protein